MMDEGWGSVIRLRLTPALLDFGGGSPGFRFLFPFLGWRERRAEQRDISSRYLYLESRTEIPASGGQNVLGIVVTI